MELFNLIVTYEVKDNTYYLNRKDRAHSVKAESEKEARLKILKKYLESNKKVVKIERVPKIEIGD